MSHEPSPGFDFWSDMRDRVAVVTGGSSGIGAATVDAFVAVGVKVGIVDMQRPATSLAAWVECDVSSPEECNRAVESTVRELGSLDYVVNCAASMRSGGLTATSEDWDSVLGVNVLGPVNMVRASLPQLQGGDHAAVVNVCSVSGLVAQAQNWPYSTSKAALLGLTRSMALDLAVLGVRVNSVSPGWIWTPASAAVVAGHREHLEAMVGNCHILGRVGEAGEVAAAILFLCSPAASFITGANLLVDGGYMALGPEALGRSFPWVDRGEG